MLRSICLLVRWHTSILASKIWRELDLAIYLAVRPSLIHGLAVARSSVHHTPFSGAFCKCARSTAKHETRADHAPRAPKALLFFLSVNSWPFIYTYAFFAGGLCERLFCASSNRLARVCIYTLTNCSAFHQAFVGLFRRFSDVRHRLISQFPSHSDIRRRRESSKK